MTNATTDYISLHCFCNVLNDYSNIIDVCPTLLDPWRDVVEASTVRGGKLTPESGAGWIAFEGIKGQVFFSQELNEWVVTSDAEDFSHEHEF